MFKLALEKAEEPEIQLPTSTRSWKKQEEFQKNIYFCFIEYAKAFDCVDHNKLWKIMKVPDLARRAGDMHAEMPFGCVEMTIENWAPQERGRWKPGEYGLQNQPMPGQARKVATAGGLSCPSDCGGGITRKIENPVPLLQPEVLIL